MGDIVEDIVIEVTDVKKKFKSYQDKAVSLKERFINPSRRKHEDVTVLNGISFRVHKGEAIGLIGKNGCGKSTTLKLLTRILHPNEGCIRIKGRVSSLIELGAGFHPDMTGRENIYTNASIFGLTRKEIDSRLTDIIRFSELEEFIDNPVRTYSSGMYMRLAFAVAINVDADVLLIDEILAVGDSAFQKKCFEKLKSIKENGTTIVIVSHSMDQMYKICDRLIWIEEGHIREEGLPRLIGEEYLAAMEGRRLDRIEYETQLEKEELEKQIQAEKERIRKEQEDQGSGEETGKAKQQPGEKTGKVKQQSGEEAGKEKQQPGEEAGKEKQQPCEETRKAKQQPGEGLQKKEEEPQTGEAAGKEKEAGQNRAAEQAVTEPEQEILGELQKRQKELLCNESLKEICPFYRSGARRKTDNLFAYTNVTVCDEDGRETNCWETGREYTIKLAYQAVKNYENVRFAMGITREDGIYCYGSYKEILELPALQGLLEFRFKNGLLKGKYVLDLWIEDFSGAPYDSIYSLMAIEVNTDPYIERGILAMEHTWKVCQRTEL